jgi:thymidylate synthase
MGDGTIREGRNGTVKSTFIQHLCFDLRNGFPLLTTRKMFFRGIVEELLFFIRGETDSKKLEEKNVNIWKGNTNRTFLNTIGMTSRKEGIMGPMYGFQWRHFNAPYNPDTGKAESKGIDQLEKVIDMIKSDPTSRRILMTDFNPAQVEQGVLYPCHSIIMQFYVEDTYIDCFCFNRSSDLFHGLSFNIASTSLLFLLIASVTKLNARYLHLSLGDSHIYSEHLDAVKEQLTRRPFTLPKLTITKELRNVNDIENLTISDFILDNYKFHDTIKVDMVA